MKEPRHKRLHIVQSCLHEISRIGKSVKTEPRLVMTRDQEEREIRSDRLMGTGSFWGGDKNVLELERW